MLMAPLHLPTVGPAHLILQKSNCDGVNVELNDCLIRKGDAKALPWQQSTVDLPLASESKRSTWGWEGSGRM